MKTILALALVTAFSISSVSEAATTVNSKDAKVSIARVVNVVPIAEKPGLQVSVSVLDLGGSTDVSPTQTVYFSLYRKGEMFSTDATFKISDVLSLESVKRVSGGIYEVKAMTYDQGIALTTYTIDAIKAIVAIEAVNCKGDFDCENSSKFKSTVEVTTKNEAP